VLQMPSVLRALNPWYAYNLLVSSSSHVGFVILGAVFLCTTGAEALYSDLGHCGRANIRVSWVYVKTCLILNYLGQSVWLLQHSGEKLNGLNPFYLIMPSWFLIFGIGIATVAAIIASQALISGSFTLIAEAVRLNLWPKVRINYPTEQKGQLYVPSINWILCAGCIIVVLLFRESEKMEAAYGLSITVAMLMTTILVTKFLQRKKVPVYLIGSFFVVYLLIEGTFLAGNLAKFYAGSCYLQLGDFNNAVKYLKDFSTDSKDIELRATGLLGDAYAEQGKKEEAVAQYKKAGTMIEKDDFNSPEYLFRAGYLSESMNKNSDAIEMYKKIKEKYPNSQRAYDIDKYLARLGETK
ncbi:MAG: tetratricopeptide repeat protein, partial [Sphingobacteriales bacterium]